MDIVEFADRCGVKLWATQKVVLKLFYGLELDDSEKFMAPQISMGDPWNPELREEFFTEKSYAEHLQRNRRLSLPADPRKLILVGGRRIGKSMIIQVIAAYEAYTELHSSVWKGLQVSGVASANVGIISYTRDSASAILQDTINLCYSSGLFPIPEATIRGFTEWRGDDSISRLGIHTRLAQSIRGWSFRAVLLDELSLFPKASVGELMSCLIAAVGPVGGKIVAASTPVTDEEALWPRFFKHSDPQAMVVQIPTWEVQESGFDLASLSGIDIPTFLCDYGAQFFERKSVLVPRTLPE